MATARIVTRMDYLTRQSELSQYAGSFVEVSGIDAHNIGPFDQANLWVWDATIDDATYEAIDANPNCFIIYGSKSGLDETSYSSGSTLDLENQRRLRSFLIMQNMSAADITTYIVLTDSRSAIASDIIAYVNTLAPVGNASIPNQFWFGASHLGTDGDGLSPATAWRLTSTVEARYADATIGEHDVLWWDEEHKSLNDIKLAIPANVKYVDIRGTSSAALLNINGIRDGDDAGWSTKSGFVKEIAYAWGGGNPPTLYETTSLGVTYSNLPNTPTMTAVPQVTVTGVSQTNPAVVTYTGDDNLSNGMVVIMEAVPGMVEIDLREFTVANLNTGAKTFELQGEDATGHTAYGAGNCVSAKIPADVGEYYLSKGLDKLILRPSDAVSSDTIASHSYCVSGVTASFNCSASGSRDVRISNIKMCFGNNQDGVLKGSIDGIYVSGCEFKHCENVLMNIGNPGNDQERFLFDNNWMHDLRQGPYMNSHVGGRMLHCWQTRNRYERANVLPGMNTSNDGHNCALQGGGQDIYWEYNLSDASAGTMQVFYFENLQTADSEHIYERLNIIKSVALLARVITEHGIQPSGDNQDATLLDYHVIHHNVIRDVQGDASRFPAGVRTKRSYDATKLGIHVHNNWILDCPNGIVINNESLVQAKGRYEFNKLIGNTIQIYHSTNHADDTAIEIDNQEYFETQAFHADGTDDILFTNWQTTASGKFNASAREANSTFTLDGTAARASALALENSITAQVRVAA